jgi:hypothetical protein
MGFLKDAMEGFLRRNDDAHASTIKDFLGELYQQWGPTLFIQPVDGKEAALTPLPTAVAVPVSVSSENKQDLSGPARMGETAAEIKQRREHDERQRAIEESLFHLYSSEVRSRIARTALIVSQHAQRFDLVTMFQRTRKVHSLIAEFLASSESWRIGRERMLLQSSLLHHQFMERQRYRSNRSLIKKYGSGNSNVMINGAAVPPSTALVVGGVDQSRANLTRRLSTREQNQLRNLEKALKVYRYEQTYSRPYPRPVPLRDPPHYYSGLKEFWQLDASEAPTRMRRLLKKNYDGNPHWGAADQPGTGSNVTHVKQQAVYLLSPLTSIIVYFWAHIVTSILYCTGSGD